MKLYFYSRSLVVTTLLSLAQAYTWPDSRVDVAEGAMYEATVGIGATLRSFVFPCQTALIPISGGTDAAEWLRTAYHDMATADVAAGIGGIDASIAFETLRDENKGNAFNNTIQVFRQFQSARLSMADVIALGTRIAVQSCSDGKVLIPLRAGRVDATGPGPSGVPEPQQSLDEHTKNFARQGFNVSEMIAMVACGHTIGGMHGLDFPDIVPDNPSPNNTESVQSFDDTLSVFDNHIATGFVSNSTQNALAFGPNETTRSDFRIFTHPADGGGNLIGQMAASEEFFFSTCQSILARMLNVVPRSVQLTGDIAPIRVKPTIFGMFVNENDATITINGLVRILEDGTSSRNRIVSVHALPRNLNSCNKTANAASGCSSPLQTNLPQASTQDTISGYPALTWYTLDLTVPIVGGITSFSIQIDEGGKALMENNGGVGFPINDIVFPIIVPVGKGQPVSCRSFNTIDGIFNSTIHVQTAVRDDLIDPATLELVGHSPISDASPVQRYEEIRAPMVNWRSYLANIGYSVYNATMSATWNPGVSGGRGFRNLDIVAKSKDGARVENTFWSWDDLPDCPVAGQ